MTEKEIKLCVGFGNYLLSEERKKSIEDPENLNVVGDWDIKNFEAIQNKNNPYYFKIVKYGTDHCAPCKAMDDNILKVKEYFTAKGYVVETEVKDADDEAVIQEMLALKSRSTPTTVLYVNTVNGLELFETWIGLKTVDWMVDTIEDIY